MPLHSSVLWEKEVGPYVRFLATCGISLFCHSLTDWSTVPIGWRKKSGHGRRLLVMQKGGTASQCTFFSYKFKPWLEP